MGSKLAPIAILGRGRFGGRQSHGVGGNRFAGAHEEFPLGKSSFMASFLEWENDFLSAGDFFQEVFTGATGTVPTPDWTIVGISSPTSALAGLRSMAMTSANQAANGIVRITAGTADSTGNQAARVITGTNIGGPIPLITQPTVAAFNPSANPFVNISPVPANDRRIAFSCRFAIAESGTATQSGISIGLTRDEAANLSNTGVVAGIASFGFTKAPGSNTLQFYTRQSASPATLFTVGTVTPNAVGATPTLTTAEASPTWHRATFVLKKFAANSLAAEIYFNGLFVGTYTNTTSTNIPSDAGFGPFFAVTNGTGCDAALDVDYYWAVTERV